MFEKQRKMNKKGFVKILSSLPMIIIMLGIVVIVVAIIGSISESTQNVLGPDACSLENFTTFDANTQSCTNGSSFISPTSIGWNATGNSLSGFSQFSSYLPQVGLVAAAIILIALVFSIFNAGKQNKKDY